MSKRDKARKLRAKANRKTAGLGRCICGRADPHEHRLSVSNAEPERIKVER